MNAISLTILAIGSLIGSFANAQAETIVPDNSPKVTYQAGAKVSNLSVAGHSITTVEKGAKRVMVMTTENGIITKTCFNTSETKSTCQNTFISDDGKIRTAKSFDEDVLK